MLRKIYQFFVYSLWGLMGVWAGYLAVQIRELYPNYLDRQAKLARADKILEGAELEACLKQNCQNQNCVTLNDWKAAYYNVFGTDTACAVAIYKQNPLKLQKHVPSPRSRKCYTRADFAYLTRENLPEDAAAKHFSSMKMPPAKATGRFLIPKRLNFVWMTSKNKFDTDPRSFHKVNWHTFSNVQATHGWQHILWVNDINLVPTSLQHELITQRIELKELSALKIKDKKHRMLREIAIQHANKEDWGIASDVARDLVEYYEGGIYLDGDYKIFDAPTLELYMQSYKSFFGINAPSLDTKFSRLSNAFMASEQHGRVARRKLELDYRNLAQIQTAPTYIQYPCNHSNGVIAKTGPLALTLAFIQVHQATDAALPYCALYQMKLYTETGPLCLFQHQLGNDGQQGSWRKSKDSFVY